MNSKLTDGEFRQLIKTGPLVSVDLVVKNDSENILLLRRTTNPAKGFFFVPGGRIFKNETIEAAFARIIFRELGTNRRLSDARLLGVYNHIYDTNRFDEDNYGTHYVSITYETRSVDYKKPTDDEHDEFKWFSEAELLQRNDVHQYVKNYFIESG
jgi:colanic acid biosynthesis protein WcaH